jgi:hypothetical protein
MAMRAKTQTSVNVNKWQAGRASWKYDPTMQFYWRFIMVTLHEALQHVDGVPTDEALLARDWFATSEMPPAGAVRECIAFPDCCHWLGVKVDAERVAFLALIDSKADFDTDECWERLERLSAQEPEDGDSLFELPDEFRVCPELDQVSLLQVPVLEMRRQPKPRRVQPLVLAAVLDIPEQLSMFAHA